MNDIVCPRCGVPERPLNPLAAARLRQAGSCQGCRASASLSSRPWLLPLFVEFWRKAGFPASDSWHTGLGSAADQETDTAAFAPHLHEAGIATGLPH